MSSKLEQAMYLLKEANRFLKEHEVWDGECPMNELSEFNACYLEMFLEGKDIEIPEGKG